MRIRRIFRTWLPLISFLGLWACGGESVSSPDSQNAAGNGGAAGAAGSGGSTVGAVPYRNQKVSKVDLLFMIDNSASTADKQKILAAAVPDLVERLTNPACVDSNTRAQVGTVAPGESCRDFFPGSEREFDPIVDMHIGVITSSLGGHGADSCSNVPTQNWNPRQEDMAHLITRGKDESGVALTVDTYQGRGFLNWDPTGTKSSPPGESDINRLKTNFTYMVRGADQDGCGFEASLEAWYRFLVDPAPYERMVPVPCYDGDTSNQCRGRDGVDQVVLTQRRDFLRPDSQVGIIMLTDENDCSVMDERQFFLALQALDGTGSFHLAHGTNACLNDPWDENCKSCWEVSAAEFPECGSGWANPEKDDTLNLRCFEQKRRFGIDFLYPVRRYVDGLSDPRLDDGTLNPLFCQEYTDGSRTKCASVLRDRSLIFLAGIVGVPWQDVAVDPGNLKQGYRPAEQLTWTPQDFANHGMAPPNGLPEGKTLWNMILGEVDENPGTDTNGDGLITADEKNLRFGSIVPTVEPIDPLMRESVDPRTGIHPVTGVDLAQPGTTGAGHPVNGAEWNIPARNDLQYTCVFDLGAFGPVDCSLPENAFGCDCNQAPENPLCWNGSSYGIMQYRAKAYPGRRQLAVLKGMGDQAVVASVCPANMTDTASADFGYRPAIQAIVGRLKDALQGTCWGQELPIAADGTVPCAILEATKGQPDSAGNVMCPPCTGARQDPTEKQIAGLEHDASFVQNGMSCICQIAQASPGAELNACVSEAIVADLEGWCYIDPAQAPSHNSDIVASCPPGGKRLIRFVGSDIPASGSLTYLFCDD